MRILFVENHATFAQQVCPAFLRNDEVTVTPSLAQARDLLAGAPWDVLLIDFDLDDGKGVELVLELASRNPRPKLVAVSAFDEKNQAMLKAGADAACSKLQFSRIGQVLAELGK